MIKILVAVLLFLFPLFFLPITTEFFEFNKMYLLYAFNLLFLAYWIIKIVKTRSFSFKSSKFDFLVVVFLICYLLSLMFNWKALNQYSAVSVTYYIFNLTFLYFVIVNLTKPTDKKFFGTVVSVTAIILSLFSFMLFFLPKTRFPISMTLPGGFALTIGDSFWSPTGGSLVTLAFLLLVLCYQLPSFLKSLNERFSTKFLINFSFLFVIAAGVFLLGYQLIFLNQPLILPLSFGWIVAVEGFKPLSNFLFGAGPGNFISAFTRFKPVALNSGKLWNLRFNVSSNEYFQLLSTIGLFGLIAFLLLSIKTIKTSLKKGQYLLPGFLVLSLILPASYLTLFLFYVFLGLLASEDSQESVSLKINNNLSFILPGLVSLLFLIMFYFGARAYQAEVNFRQSIIAVSQNKAKEAYDLELKAMKLNPYNDTYRLNFSLLNLALAQNLSAKKDLTDQEKQTISQLLNQAVNEARNAAALSPSNSSNWANLAQVYRNLINSAQGADQWAATSYSQAINLDPANPTLRVDLGGLYFALGNYDSAIDLFKSAINIKSDLANAYFNLAYAYAGKKEYASAATAMETVLTLVDKNSNDFKKAQSDLEELKKLLPTPSVTQTPAKPETLAQPEPLPTKQPEITPIVLPSPLPSPTTSITVSPTVTVNPTLPMQ